MRNISKKDIVKRFSRIDIEKLFNDPLIHLPQEDFKDEKRKQLNERMISLKKVYLDIKYWVNIRKCIFREPDRNEMYKKVFDLLKELVNKNIIICPISQTIFFELLKQKYSRVKTAQMIDILSNGVCFNETNIIRKAEMYNLLAKEYSNKMLVENYLWNKIVCILGEPGIETTDGKQLPNSFVNGTYNVFLEMKLQDLVSNDDMFDNDFEREEYLAKLLNVIFTNPENDKSFSKIKSEELLSALNILARKLKITPKYNFDEFLTLSSDEELIKVIPSILVFSLIHSLYSYEKNRKYKKNDISDIEHSSLAVGYCDYFFTEDSYYHILHSKLLNIEVDFNIAIESDPIKAYEVLHKLL